MNDYDFNTSYVSGMTKIPPRTIQEYVSTFRDHFSPKAAQQVKGRRFLPADIDKLQLIKRLRAERATDEEIKGFLSGEVNLPEKLAHQFSDREIKDMAAHSLEIFERANNAMEKSGENLYDAKRMIVEAQKIQQQTRLEIQAFRNQINSFDRTLGKFRDWQLYMMKLDPDFNPYVQEEQAEPLPKKKGIFGLGG